MRTKTRTTTTTPAAEIPPPRVPASNLAVELETARPATYGHVSATGDRDVLLQLQVDAGPEAVGDLISVRLTAAMAAALGVQLHRTGLACRPSSRRAEG